MEAFDEWIGVDADDCRIERELGRGGMAVVYKARDLTLGRAVAIKILPPESTQNDEMIQRFEREAKIVARVNHPNIAQVYRIGRVRGCPYYAMEFIDGVSLSQLIKEKGRLGGLQTVDYLLQACKGLRAAAEHGIIHRDIKPANLMVTREGTIKIVDFGIAKIFHDDTFQTKAGAIIGTPRYMSPEQGRGQKVDQRSDIYSLGATGYHLLTGRPPFDSDNAVTLMLKHIQEPVRAISETNDRVPYRLCNIIYGMLGKNPAERTGSYDELIAGLEKAFKDEDAREGAPALTRNAAPALSLGSGYASVAAPAGGDGGGIEGGGMGMWKGLLAAALLLIIVTGFGAYVLKDAPVLDDSVMTPSAIAAADDPQTPTVGGTVNTLREIHRFRQELDDEEKEKGRGK